MTAGELDGRLAVRASVKTIAFGSQPGTVTADLRAAPFTTKTKGTGLGMAITKRIIDAHGRQIAIGEGGPGAEIIITLPRGIP